MNDFQPDYRRRFGGLARLYGAPGAERIATAHVLVVGIGGVGSWSVEALARSGVRRLTLIDLDHVSESNVNRQVHALSETLGQSKVDAMAQRIRSINPDCQIDAIDAFVEADGWPSLLAGLPVPDAVIDACDDLSAKATLVDWACRSEIPAITCGAAGGKQRAELVEVSDLSDVTHDPLLAKLRYHLRRHLGYARTGSMGVSSVFSRESVAAPRSAICETESFDGSLSCHGYGSLVSVTATFGFVASGRVLNLLTQGIKKMSPLPESGKKTL